jgi:hypothetical protein
MNCIRYIWLLLIINGLGCARLPSATLPTPRGEGYPHNGESQVAVTPVRQISCSTATHSSSQDSFCYRSSFYPREAGHYHFQLRLKEPVNPAHLLFRGELTAVNREGAHTPVTGGYTGRGEVEYPLLFTSYNRITPTRYLTLSPPPYPLDGGWIPENIFAVSLEITSNTSLFPGELLVSRSKWNSPLRDRLKEAPSIELPAEPWSPIAVNLQGLSRDQLLEVKEARANWKPRGKVLIIAQLDPRDLNTNSLSTDAYKVLEELIAWRSVEPRIAFGCSVNPYLNASHHRDSVRFFDGSTTTAMRDILKPYVAARADAILLRTDDFAPVDGDRPFDYSLSAPKDIRLYGGLGRAHSTWVNEVAAEIARESPETKVVFVPPWYATRFIDGSPERAHDYYRILSKTLSASIPVVWTGPSVRSLEISDQSFLRIKELLPTHSLMLWDNTPYARAHKDFWLKKPYRAHLCSSIEPYDIPISRLFLDQPTAVPPVLVNTGVSPLQRIQLETTQLYLTAPDHYHPEAALLEVLNHLLGSRTATHLLEFDNRLWTAYSSSLAVGKEVSRDELQVLGRIVEEMRLAGSPAHQGLTRQLLAILEAL